MTVERYFQVENEKLFTSFWRPRTEFRRFPFNFSSGSGNESKSRSSCYQRLLRRRELRKELRRKIRRKVCKGRDGQEKKGEKVEENRRLRGMRRLRSHNPLFLQDSLVARISSPVSFVFFLVLGCAAASFRSLFSLFYSREQKAAKQKERMYGKGRGWGFKSRPQLGPVLSAKDVQELRPLNPTPPTKKV